MNDNSFNNNKTNNHPDIKLLNTPKKITYDFGNTGPSQDKNKDVMGLMGSNPFDNWISITAIHI